MNPPPPSTPTSGTLQAFDTLESLIVSGTKVEGDTLDPNTLSAELALPLCDIHASFILLTQAGLARLTSQQHAVVEPLHDDEVFEARDVVAAMHALCTRLAVPKFTDADFEIMESANQRFTEAVDRRDAHAAIAADEDFHAVTVDVAGNRAASQVVSIYSPILHRFEWRRFSTGEARASINRHECFMKLARDGDVEGAVACAHETWSSLGVPTDRNQQTPCF